MRNSLYLTIFLLLFASVTQAEIYTCKDATGKTIYTDTPAQCADAEEVKVDALPALVPSKPIDIPKSNRNDKTIEDKDIYSELVITSPANDSTLRDSQGNLTINFRVSPGLQTRRGDKFVVNVDGAEVYKGTSTITSLKNVDRGTHTINVKVIASDGSTKISAKPVSFTLHRFSALQNNSNTQNSGDNGDSGSNTSSQNFPSNTKFPTRPPTAPN